MQKRVAQLWLGKRIINPSMFGTLPTIFNTNQKATEMRTKSEVWFLNPPQVPIPKKN